MKKSKHMKTSKRNNILVVFKITLVMALLIAIFAMLPQEIKKTYTANQTILANAGNAERREVVETEVTKANDINSGKYKRLTDSDVSIYKSNVGYYSTVKINQDYNGNKLAVMREGAFYEFDYGIFAHANANIYYDISNYSNIYQYLTTYVGLNRTSAAGNGVKVYIYKSNETQFHEIGSQYWELINGDYSDTDIMPKTDAIFEKVDISGAKWLRIQIDSKGSNASDHSVFIDPMFITSDYEEDTNAGVQLSTYDEQIKNYSNKNLSDSNFEKLVLQRKFIASVGNYALKRFTEEAPENQATIDWLMNDVENLRYYIIGGTPSGGYYNSLKELTRLLKAYKNDFNDNTQISDAGKELLTKKNLNWPTTKGNLYKRMAITLSLTHSTRVGLWMQNSKYNQSDAVDRYKIYKDLYNNGAFKATDTVNMTPWFETFNIEEMRWVLGTAIDDEEVIWLNEYTQTRIDAQPGSVWGLLTPHPYMAYVWPNYSNPVYYNQDNKDDFNELFQTVKTNPDGTKTTKGLFEYVPYRNETPYTYKLWMNFRNQFGTGAVCGGISKSGHCIRGVNAIPSAVIGQPGHAALLYYNQNADGKGLWGIDNDVSGWTLSEKGERMPLGWGNDRTYVSGYNVPYITMAQEAMNNYNALVKAEETIMLADVYKGNSVEQEIIYREATKAQPINLDAWASLSKLYMADNAKTEEDYYRLAKEMMEATRAFPFPMYNLSNYIGQKLTSTEYSFKFTLLQTRMLEDTKTDGGNVLQANVSKVLASYLLGKMDTNLATFSFDGDEAGKIKLGQKFDGNIVRWDYSLDGKNTWREIYSTAENHTHKLTDAEINSITAENNIYIHIVGASYDDENIFEIDISESAGLPSSLYGNDLENRVVGVELSTEWRYKETDPWTKYKDGSPDLTGDKEVELRQGATGTYLAGKTTQKYSFTKDNQPLERRYIPVSHLNLHEVSSQATNQGGSALYAIDANYNTRWHSAWNGSDTQRFITIELDRPVFLSAVEYVPAGGGNGKIYTGKVYGSEDGDNWQVLVDSTNFTYKTQTNTIEQALDDIKSFEIAESTKVKFVKIVAEDASTGHYMAHNR